MQLSTLHGESARGEGMPLSPLNKTPADKTTPEGRSCFVRGRRIRTLEDRLRRLRALARFIKMYVRVESLTTQQRTKKDPSLLTRVFLAAGEGFEPSHTESESAVLPLHNPAVSCRTLLIIRIRRNLSIPFFRFFKEIFQRKTAAAPKGHSGREIPYSSTSGQW